MTNTRLGSPAAGRFPPGPPATAAPAALRRRLRARLSFADVNQQCPLAAPATLAWRLGIFPHPGTKAPSERFGLLVCPQLGAHDERSFWPIPLRDTLSRANVSGFKSARVPVN